MPYSTNTENDELGHAQVLRDVEALYQLIADLQVQLGAEPGGDLNPGGGASVSQQVPDNMVGSGAQSPSSASSSAVGFSAKNIGTLILVKATPTVLVLANGYTDTQGTYASNGIFTAAATGLYHIVGTASFLIYTQAGNLSSSAVLNMTVAGSLLYDESDHAVTTTIASGLNLNATVGGCFRLNAGDQVFLTGTIDSSAAFLAPSGAIFANLAILGIPS